MLLACTQRALAADVQRDNEISIITLREHAASARLPVIDYLKPPIAPRDSPLAVETIDKSLLDNGAYKDLGALLDVGSSALSTAAEGDSANDITLQGFGNTTLFRNGLNASLIGAPPASAFNIERVEILKGPDGAL